MKDAVSPYENASRTGVRNLPIVYVLYAQTWMNFFREIHMNNWKSVK